MFPERDERSEVSAWLLGLAGPEEGELIEKRMFADHGFYEELRVLEDELIRDYLTGSLPPEKRGAFERKFFSTEPLRAKVEFLRSVMAESGQVRPSVSVDRVLFGRRAAPLWAALAAALVVIIFQGWRVATLRTSLARLERATAPAASPRILASFTLVPGIERGNPVAQRRPLVVPAGDGHIQFALEPGSGARWEGRCRVSIEKPEGAVVFSALAFPDPDRKLRILAPAASLMTGDYVVTADDAAKGHATYEFRVIRQ